MCLDLFDLSYLGLNNDFKDGAEYIQESEKNALMFTHVVDFFYFIIYLIYSTLKQYLKIKISNKDLVARKPIYNQLI